MGDDLKDNLLSRSQWLRILYMVLFAVVWWLLNIILAVVVLAQVLFSLISSRDNENLRQLGAGLSLYFYRILQFLTYNTEDKPFPFAPFPSIDGEESEHSEAAGTQETADSQTADESGAATAPSAEADRTVNTKTSDDVFADISFTRDNREDNAGFDDSPTLNDAGGENKESGGGDKSDEPRE